MYKMLKKILSLALTLLTVASLCTGVLAGDVVLDDTSIKFEGVDTSWTTSDLFNNFKNVMPGDTLTQEITVKVDSKTCDFANITLTAVPHSDQNPLSGMVSEKETVESMQAFLSELKLDVYMGDELLNGFDGINGAVSLGKIETGKSVTLKVVLTVPLELDNIFANRVAEVDWVFSATAINNTTLTVLKVWKDNNYPQRPDSITVDLIRTDSDGNETKVDSQTLHKGNQWTYAWKELSDAYTWSVKETNVPDKYTVSYDTSTDGIVKIINYYDYNPPYIPWYPLPDLPDPRPQPPTETEPVETEPEKTKPVETEPEETEPPVIEEPAVRDLTVVKNWAEDKAEDRPTSVSVSLYKGDTEVEKVTLGDWNNWSYTWYDLDANEQWSVLEVEIPLGYTPTYAADGDTVIITNNAILIQTGQLNWPIPVFGGIGVLLIGAGVLLLRKKKENHNA